MDAPLTPQHDFWIRGHLLEVDSGVMVDSSLLFGFCFSGRTHRSTLLVLITFTLRQLPQYLADVLVGVDANLGECLCGLGGFRLD